MPPAPPKSFERRLHDVLQSAYTQDTLAQLLRLDLDPPVDLAVVAKPAAFGTVAFELIVWLVGQGRLAAFLVAAAKSLPDRPELAELRDEHAKTAVSADGRPVSELDAAVRRFAGQFRQRRVWLDYLRAYKQAHEALHALGMYLKEVRGEADARRLTGAAVSDTTAGALRQWLGDSQASWRKTEPPTDPPPLWLAQFVDAVADFLGQDKDRHGKALARLAALPADNMHALNAEMVRCAKRLRVAELRGDLDDTARLIGPQPPARLATVAAAIDGFRRPCERLGRAIAHDEACQNIDTELRAARGLADRTPDAILGWDVVRDGLARLKAERPGDVAAVNAAAAATGFAAVPAAATFDRLVEAFEVLFKAMDTALHTETNELLVAATQLTDSLDGPA